MCSSGPDSEKLFVLQSAQLQHIRGLQCRRGLLPRLRLHGTPSIDRLRLLEGLLALHALSRLQIAENVL